MKTDPCLPLACVALALLVLPACRGAGASVPGVSAIPPQAGGPPRPDAAGIHVEAETMRLANGMTVVLHEDHALPKVVINTWFAVGSRDEAPGRTGFAHLFEHLMFMGTGRVPGDGFDVIMESGGGSNNATTSTDRTNYFSMGPSSLLPTLLWLDADRLDALDEHMTKEKLDKQRAVVRNERRQSSENVPYGEAYLVLPAALYPAGHPYHHPVIGSHEDLEAATVADVVDFFRTHYVPGNASLVVAGDFDPQEVKQVVARTFGAIPAKPAPARRDADPPRLEGERRIVLTDDVEFPKLFLAWHSPAAYGPGDGEMDLVAAILAGGPSTRLENRLVLETGLCQEVDAFQWSRDLGSTFVIEALAAPGGDLQEIEHEIHDVLGALCREGPTAEEMGRVQAQAEARFLRGMESLFSRADSINAYRHYFGVTDGFQRDLERWTKATPEGVRRWTAEVFGPGRVDLRVLPEPPEVAALEGASLDERPEDFAARSFEPQTARTIELSNGIRVHAIPRPGTRLFSGSLHVAGGESLTPADQAGRAHVLARVLNSGAGGLDTGRFADAVESLGARIRASAETRAMAVSVSGLTSRMDETLDLFADVVLRPNLAQEDFERERTLTLAAVAKRDDDPREVSTNVGAALLFGRDDPRGRPLEGYAETVAALSLDALRESAGSYVHPANATFTFAGDFTLDGLKSALEARFGKWSADVAAQPPKLAPVVDPAPGRIVLVDRPGAPQTVVRILRPVSPAEGVERAARTCVDTVFGGTFTSRLNANLREDKGYTYGARSRIQEEREQFLLVAGASVRTDVTGASLTEFRQEFDLMAEAGLTEAELGKALETLRRQLVETAETTGRVQDTLAELVADGRPLDAVARDLEALDAVELDAADALAKGGLYAWDRLLVVLVGDRAAVLPQLAEHGFPDPLEVDAEGRALE